MTSQQCQREQSDTGVGFAPGRLCSGAIVVLPKLSSL
jgi:hypothetical protein